jgi:hypothetical protein
MWCIPNLNLEFITAMNEVLGEYEEEYNPLYPRVCLDEKSQQLLSTPRGEKPVAKEKPKRVDFEYKRHGTVNLFVAIEPKAGKRTIRVTDRRTGKDFAKFVQFLVTRVYKKAKKVHIILDNLNTHNEETLIEQLGEEKGKEVVKRIAWHHTPKHASWLNQAEIEIGVVTQQVLRKRIAEKTALVKEVRAYQERRNKAKATIKWQFTRAMAKEKFNLH